MEGNQNNNSTSQNQNGEGSQSNQGQQGNTPQNNNSQNNQNNQSNSPAVDTKKIGEDAISELLKNMGVDNEDALKNIVSEYNKHKQEGMTDLQKAQGENEQLIKQLATEREERIIAEAKVTAMELGADPEMIDDLVIVAKSKVTKEKDISAVISEIKESASGKAYFIQQDNNKPGQNSQNNRNVTRGNGTQQSQNNTNQQNNNSQNNQNNSGNSSNGRYAGTFAERFFKARKTNDGKSHYFKA